MKRKSRAKAKDPDLDADSAETMIWTCSACGVDNPDSKQTCISCGGDRAGDSAAPKPKEPGELENFEAPESKSEAAPATDESEPAALTPEPAPFTKDSDEEKPFSFSFGSEKEKPSISFSVPSMPEPEPEPEPEIKPFLPTSTPYSEPASSTPSRSSGAGTGRFYMVFVNTPAASLIKSKVPIEFDDFPTVTIGRSPENVIVVPDAEVSRKHAELTMSGSKLMLRDLNSKNGTYLYNGKEFEQVHDSVEVKPNSIVKFGTGTIVRLTGE